MFCCLKSKVVFVGGDQSTQARSLWEMIVIKLAPVLCPFEHFVYVHVIRISPVDGMIEILVGIGLHLHDRVADFLLVDIIVLLLLALF